MNKVLLIGRLTKDPELKYTPNNKAFAQVILAVNRAYQSSNGEKQADFINCVAWGKTAENLAKYMSKGGQIALEGQIQTRVWDDPKNGKRYITEVLAETIEYLAKPESSSTTPQTNTSYQQREEKLKEQFKEQDKKNPFEDVGDFDISNDDLPF